MTRMHNFEGVENFRDYGDYPIGDRRLRRGKLYRSAHHANATEEDLAGMAALGIKVIVDLRRPNERERDPSRRWPGFSGEVIQNDIAQPGEDPWVSFLQEADLSEDTFRSYMVDYYRDAPFVARHVDLYSRYFHSLAETDGAVLIHCAAGKDRTGILAALTHHVAGVSDEDILADFLLTNNPERFARRVPVMGDTIEQMTGRRPSDQALRTALGVEERYLSTAFAAIKTRHGSIDGYLEEVLGLDAAMRDRVHAAIIDD
jgi:protein tyrosine/serine phosphatase